MDQKQIAISCKGANSADLSAFVELQGELKTLSPANYEALRAEIIEQGFSFSVHVWDNGGALTLLDGHQRIRTLKKMIEEGWAVGPIPYSLVFADNYQQAKTKLLGAASNYGDTTEAGLAKFLVDMKIDPVKLSNFPLPKINMPAFIGKMMPAIAGADLGDVGSMPTIAGTQVSGDHAGPVSHVRMIQVFLDDALFIEFMDKATALQQHFGKDNLSDAILEVVRAQYNAIQPNHS